MHVCVSFKAQQLNVSFAKQCDKCATVLPYQEQKQTALVLCTAVNGLVCRAVSGSVKCTFCGSGCLVVNHGKHAIVCSLI